MSPDGRSKRVLIVYVSVEGQTRKIAREIRDELKRSGLEADLADAGLPLPAFDRERYNGVMIGAPVRHGRYPRKIYQWTRHNAKALEQIPGAFFSVCLGVLEKSPKTEAAEARVIEEFFMRTGWRPENWMIFAGALRYSKYGWFKSWFMRSIAKRSGAEAGVTEDYEFTDWNAVRGFARDFATEWTGFQSIKKHGAVDLNP